MIKTIKDRLAKFRTDLYQEPQQVVGSASVAEETTILSVVANTDVKVYYVGQNVIAIGSVLAGQSRINEATVKIQYIDPTDTIIYEDSVLTDNEGISECLPIG